MNENPLPNVVLIYMDDMTHWALRSEAVHTPNLDRLRARGTTFTHAFNQGSMVDAVCMPARQMLISGLTLFHAADRFMDVPRIGQTLTKAGYDTYFTGKWHNQVQALESDYGLVGPWAGSWLPSTPIGGDAYSRPHPDNTWDPTDITRGGHWMVLSDGSVQHSSERWTDAAVSFIANHHARAPFFLHLAYHAPHDPRQVPAEFLDLYSQDDIEVPPNFMPEHPFDNGDLSVRDEMLAPAPRTPHAIRFHRREYFAIITHVDAQIGRLLDAIDKFSGQAGTIIVFSGDHGLALGEHGLLGKQNSYDHSIRVPLVVVGPGVDAGVERSNLVYSGSIYPTICELATIARPPHIEFPSLVPVLRGHDQGENVVFGAYKDLQRLVRGDRYKLIEYSDRDNNQLFDLNKDPWEMRNIYHHLDYTEKRDALTKTLRAEQARLGDPQSHG